MKYITVLLILASSAIAQTPTPVTPPIPAPIPALGQPTYIAAGGAYNQFSGANAWASGIFPLSLPAGLLMSMTVDIFPVKTVTNGKTGYLLTTSARAGIHRFIVHGAKNSLLIGADGGYSWAQAAAGGTLSSGVSAAVTITYVHQFTPAWGAMFPVRMLYMPTLGGWNPILEGGIVWTPGAK